MVPGGFEHRMARSRGNIAAPLMRDGGVHLAFNATRSAKIALA